MIPKIPTTMSDTMKAVVFKGPHQIAIEERPVPKLQADTDVIVKVALTALCGRYISPHRPLFAIHPAFHDAMLMVTRTMMTVNSMYSADIRRAIPGSSWCALPNCPSSPTFPTPPHAAPRLGRSRDRAATHHPVFQSNAEMTSYRVTSSPALSPRSEVP